MCILKPVEILRTIFVLAVLLAGVKAQEKPADPDRLAKLRESWKAARERALRPLDAKYREELNLMMQEYTRAGRLDEAVAVKNEIALLSPTNSADLAATANPEPPKAKFIMDGAWKITHYAENNAVKWSGVRQVEGGNLTDYDGKKLKIDKRGNKIRILWPKGFEELMIDERRPDELTGINDKNHRVVWVRVKK